MGIPNKHPAPLGGGVYWRSAFKREGRLYKKNRFYPLLCGYFSTQTALVYLIEKWKFKLDKKRYAGTILIDLSKTFDTINHELLVAKLNAYGFSKEALKSVFNYSNNRKTKI